MSFNHTKPPVEYLCSRKEEAKKLLGEIIDKLEILEGHKQIAGPAAPHIAKFGYCDISHLTAENNKNWFVYDNSSGLTEQFFDLSEVVAYILKRWW